MCLSIPAGEGIVAPGKRIYQTSPQVCPFLSRLTADAGTEFSVCPMMVAYHAKIKTAPQRGARLSAGQSDAHIGETMTHGDHLEGGRSDMCPGGTQHARRRVGCLFCHFRLGGAQGKA